MALLSGSAHTQCTVLCKHSCFGCGRGARVLHRQWLADNAIAQPWRCSRAVHTRSAQCFASTAALAAVEALAFCNVSSLLTASSLSHGAALVQTRMHAVHNALQTQLLWIHAELSNCPQQCILWQVGLNSARRLLVGYHNRIESLCFCVAQAALQCALRWRMLFTNCCEAAYACRLLLARR